MWRSLRLSSIIANYCKGVKNVRYIKTDTNLAQSITIENVNPRVLAMDYAIRGPVAIRASEIEKELQQGIKKPFIEVIKANLGDAQAMGQIPLTFMRQVLTLINSPKLMDGSLFPEDAVERVKMILQGCKGGSVGSYSDPVGVDVVRKHAARYIEKRDGFPSDWQNIILTTGATDGIKNLINIFNCEINGKQPGVMVPVPQFPLYSALLTLNSMHQINYYLDEDQQWGLNLTELQRAIDEAREVSHPRIIVVINPGNPTGQVISKENIHEIIKFAFENNLYIFADEVYQHNIYDEASEFHSFKKVVNEMGEPYSRMGLSCFISASKGYMSECGFRGGYTEMVNMCPKVKAMYLKSITILPCSPILGQAAVDVVVNPPQPGEPSYELFTKEKTQILDSLKLKAKMTADTLNSFEGYSCNVVQGAMYAFPRINLPPKAIEAAKAANQSPDDFYTFQLLENTGILVVPGSGFGQKPGTHHFRTTILPQPQKLKMMLGKFQAFHQSFIQKYG